jgi:dihydropteroate synthase
MRTQIMGILNVTPDSFFDGGQHNTCDAAFEYALRLVREGASIIDIGGESTRPGASRVSAEEELSRVLPVLKRLAQIPGRTFKLSIDTTKAQVAGACLDAGADIINDVSSYSFDPLMESLLVERKPCVILQHLRGTAEAPTDGAEEGLDIVETVVQFLTEKVKNLISKGYPKEKIWLDPGIGFGKTLEQNLTMVREIGKLCALGYPVCLGVSRKSYLGKKLVPSLVHAVWGAGQGVAAVRVHDVAATQEALDALEALHLVYPIAANTLA